MDIYDNHIDYMYPQEFFHVGFGSFGTKGEGIYQPDIVCWSCEKPIPSEDFFCPYCGAGSGSLDPTYANVQEFKYDSSIYRLEVVGDLFCYSMN